jgi:cysteine desulfuration protein SufE
MPTFADIAETFRSAGTDFRLELMREYAQRLPDLPEAYAEMRDAGLGTVPECQSPVFLYVEVEDERVRIHADAPREAATARAFLAILREAFHDARPAAVRAAPDDPLEVLGWADRVGLQRRKGLTALYRRVQQAVEEK